MKGSWCNGPWRMSEVNESIRLRGLGWSYKRIAAHLGRSASSVEIYCKRHGKAKRLRVTAEQEALILPRILQLRREGLSWARISRRFGHRGMWARDLAVRQGAPLTRGGDWRTGRKLSPSSRTKLSARKRHDALDAARAAGWPEADTPHLARPMELLSRRALTRQELREALGHRCTNSTARVLTWLRRRGYLEWTATYPKQYRLAAWLCRRHDREPPGWRE